MGPYYSCMPTTMDLRKIGSHIQPPRSAYKYAWFACIASHHTLAVDPVQLQLQRKERETNMASSKRLLVFALLLAAVFLVASAANEQTREFD